LSSTYLLGLLVRPDKRYLLKAFGNSEYWLTGFAQKKQILIEGLKLTLPAIAQFAAIELTMQTIKNADELAAFLILGFYTSALLTLGSSILTLALSNTSYYKDKYKQNLPIFKTVMQRLGMALSLLGLIVPGLILVASEASPQFQVKYILSAENQPEAVKTAILNNLLPAIFASASAVSVLNPAGQTFNLALPKHPELVARITSFALTAGPFVAYMLGLAIDSLEISSSTAGAYLLGIGVSNTLITLMLTVLRNYTINKQIEAVNQPQNVNTYDFEVAEEQGPRPSLCGRISAGFWQAGKVCMDNVNAAGRATYHKVAQKFGCV
jgi:hypothetical protein